MKKIISTIALGVLLSGCGGSGGGGGVAPERPAGNIGGKSYDSELIGSTIRLYTWDQGNRGSEVLAETVTDENGDYQLNPVHADSFMVLEATGGYYIEEATGTKVELKPDQKLTALIRYESGNSINQQITTATHWATCQAEYRAKKQGINNTDALGLSYEVFASVVGVPIRATTPLNITDPVNASPTLTEGLRYGMWTAAISSLTKELAEASGLPPHEISSTTSIHLAKIGCNDLRADGKLDGMGYTVNDTDISQLGFGNIALTPYIYRTKIAQHILAVAGDTSINKTGLDQMALLNTAQALSMSDGAVFDSLTPEPVDLDGPEISTLISENTYLKGDVALHFTIEDQLDIKNVKFFIDDVFVDNGSSLDTTMNFLSQYYTDGVHTIKVTASDSLGNESVFTRDFNFDNSGPIVAVTSPQLVNDTAYIATGTFEAEGSAIKGVTVNGVTAFVNVTTSTWEAEVALSAGNNSVVVQAEDQSGNLGPQISVNVAVDTVFPIINNAESQIRLSTGQNQLNLCNSSQMQDTNDNAICVADNRVSLNGQVVNGNLTSYGYVLIGYTVNDLPVDGVFTNQDDLLIEYQVYKDGDLYQDWRTAPTRATNYSIWYLPITTEYFGDTWYQTSIDSIFEITIRVTDNAGNEGKRTFSMSFDVLPGYANISASLTDENLFTGSTFSTRSFIDGQDYNIVYSYVNDSQVEYAMNIEDLQNSELLHSYETAIRKNRARINTQEEWEVRYATKLQENTADQIYVQTDASYKYLSGWTPATSLIYWTNAGANQTTITPAALVNGTYENYYTDTVDTPAADPWSYVAEYSQDDAKAVYYPPDYCSYFCSYPAEYFNLQNPNNSNQYVYYLNNMYPFGIIRYYAFNFRTRNTYSVQYEDGYPRTEKTTINNDPAPILTESLLVYNETDKTEILTEDNGWYRIPAGKTVTITKTIPMPNIVHYNDTEMTEIGYHGLYTTQNLDLSTTWNLDTDVKITRAVAPADIWDVDNQTKAVQTVGEGVKSYTISR